MSNPIISIIIPTRNRASYAYSCVCHLLGISDPDFEVVVHDNSPGAELQQKLQDLRSDSRLRYIRTENAIDVVENFELATTYARGEYVVHIGDDDGVSLSIVECARWAKKMGFDAVVPKCPAQYYWPSHRFYYYGDRLSGTLTVPRFSLRHKEVDCERALQRCLASGGQSFDCLPRSYQGFVRRAALEEVRTRCGTYFPGPSPDLAGAIALSTIIRSCVELDFPFIIVGTSASSAGGWGAQKAHVGRLEDWPHLPRWSIERWSKIVPRFFSGRTIWAEDVVQALNACGRSEWVERLNVAKLYGMCFVAHRNERALIELSIRHAAIGRSAFRRLCLRIGIFWHAAAYYGLRARRLFETLAMIVLKHGVVSSLATIEDAGHSLAKRASLPRGVLSEPIVAVAGKIT